MWRLGELGRVVSVEEIEGLAQFARRAWVIGEGSGAVGGLEGSGSFDGIGGD